MACLFRGKHLNSYIIIQNFQFYNQYLLKFWRHLIPNNPSSNSISTCNNLILKHLARDEWRHNGRHALLNSSRLHMFPVVVRVSPVSSAPASAPASWDVIGSRVLHRRVLVFILFGKRNSHLDETVLTKKNYSLLQFTIIQHDGSMKLLIYYGKKNL